jgi:hypothetical protein
VSRLDRASTHVLSTFPDKLQSPFSQHAKDSLPRILDR